MAPLVPTPTLSDLRYLFYGGGSAEEYAFMLEAYNLGISAMDLLTGGTGGVEISPEDPTEIDINPTTGKIDLLATIARTPRQARKTTAAQSNITVVAADIPELLITGLLANSKYQIEGQVLVDGLGGGNGDYVQSFTTPAGAVSGTWGAVGPGSAEGGVAPSSTLPLRARSWTQAEEFGTVGAGTIFNIQLNGNLITGGIDNSLQPKFAQRVADATPTRVHPESWLNATYVGAA